MDTILTMVCSEKEKRVEIKDKTQNTLQLTSLFTIHNIVVGLVKEIVLKFIESEIHSAVESVSAERADDQDDHQDTFAIFLF